MEEIEIDTPDVPEGVQATLAHRNRYASRFWVRLRPADGLPRRSEETAAAQAVDASPPRVPSAPPPPATRPQPDVVPASKPTPPMAAESASGTSEQPPGAPHLTRRESPGVSARPTAFPAVPPMRPQQRKQWMPPHRGCFQRLPRRRRFHDLTRCQHRSQRPRWPQNPRLERRNNRLAHRTRYASRFRASPPGRSAFAAFSDETTAEQATDRAQSAVASADSRGDFVRKAEAEAYANASHDHTREDTGAITTQGGDRPRTAHCHFIPTSAGTSSVR